MLSDWLKLIVLLATSNRITLFHKRVITLYSKLFTHLASYDKEPWRAWSEKYLTWQGADHIKKYSSGLVVMGGDSCSKGHVFNSQHHILDGHFFSYLFVVKFVLCVCKDENKWKRGQGWPVFMKKYCRLLANACF